jgi:DNA-binding protein HU-beta
MNKTELAAEVATRTGVTKSQALEMVTATVAVITEELKAKGQVNITDLGKFTAKESAAREGRNPQTGETIQISARTTPKFSASATLKKGVQ